MSAATLFFQVLYWHYAVGIGEVIRAWGALHVFLYHFFSVPVLLTNLFAPFHRLREEAGDGFMPSNLAEVLIVNTMMRVVGFFVRATILITAFVAEAALLVVGLVALLISLLGPFATIAFILFAVFQLVS